MATANRALAALLLPAGLALGLAAYGFAPAPGGGAKQGWVDYDDLTETERLKQRPGNYLALGAVSDFLTAMYQVRPDYRPCAFPFQENGKTFENLQAAQKALDRAARGRTVRNKVRQYNLDIKSLTAYDPDEMIRSPELRKKTGFSDHHLKRLQTVRKRHPGRAVLVLANLPLSSLQSPKVEGGKGEDVVFYLVEAGGRWKVAWFDT